MKLKSLSLLLALTLSSPALAIGLGELSVRSHLGQALHLTVEVTDPSPSVDEACFGLHPAPNGLALPTHTRFSVERNGTRTVLHITTRERFVEPAAQFVLSSDCEGRLQREYVLLLDPPPVPDAISDGSHDATSIILPHTADEPVAVRPSAPVRTTASMPDGSKRQTLQTQPRRRSVPKPPVAAVAPRLVISGKSMSAAGLDGDASASGPALTIAELSDENTALLRKLAHIEAQLIALNQRNAELEARLNAVLPAPSPAAAMPSSRWLVNSVGLLGLLAGSGAVFAWWRRRGRSYPADPASMAWLPDRASPTTAGHVATPTIRAPAFFSPQQEADEFPVTAGSTGTEVREDAIDQAEVLAVHGYAGLAIQLLREHLRATPSESPTPWLLLLDLLHRERDDTGYTEACAEFRRHFNVNFPERPTEGPLDDSEGLLAYPHILDMLTQAWNTPALTDIFQNLIFDKRGGMRVGFAPGAYQDILLLRDIARTALPSSE